jgi:hypothetical protein
MFEVFKIDTIPRTDMYPLGNNRKKRIVIRLSQVAHFFLKKVVHPWS